MRTATLSTKMYTAMMSLPALVGLLLFPLASPQIPIDSRDVMGSASAALPKMETTWEYEDLKLLDSWGDSESDAQDIVAVYEKEASDNALYFRVDVMDLRGDARPELFLAIDYRSGGNAALFRENPTLASDLQWDLLLWLNSAGQEHLYDSEFTDTPTAIALMNADSTLDFVEIAIARESLTGWDGAPFTIQAIVLSSDDTRIADKTAPTGTDAAAGRAKLVLIFGNMFANWGPSVISWYDGFAFPPPDRPVERSGSKYLFDAVEKYGVPMTTVDLRMDVLPANEYLGINARLRDLAARGLLDPLFSLTYGYFMPWQPADVDAQAIRMAREAWEDLGLPQGEVMVPYEAMLTAGDLEAIKGAGFSAVYAYDHYGYWFGWIKDEDWGDPARVANWYRGFRKIHRANDLLFFFGLHSFFWDSRWNDLAIEPGWFLQRYDSFVGADGGLHHGWRRVLLDMALDPDQEQYISMGSDLWLTSWYLPQDVDQSLRWIANHPWIEATTFNDLLKRNWTPVDHGDLGLAPEQPLDQHYPPQAGTADYFWQFYYGGVSDGHSQLIPAGTPIEGYFDYVPYLRDGQPIPSGRKMGDDQTPDAIVYETLRNLRGAPDNALARLAWRAYLMTIAEQTFHSFTDYRSGEKPGEDTGGPYLHPGAKSLSNLVRQVNKIVAGAVWAEGAAQGRWAGETQVVSVDLDLDGENEYVLRNDQVFAIFEDDGGRLEYAFAYDPSVGPVALVAPHYLTRFPGRTDFEAGESPADDPWIEAAFEDAAWDEGKRFRVERFSVEAGEDSLTFTSPDGRIRKNFRLERDTVLAHYTTRDVGDLTIAFALPTGLVGMYSPGWWEGIEPVSAEGSAGWQTAGQGYAAVNLLDTRLNTQDSFLDSSARSEMREPDPGGEPYPPGHWEPFPFNVVTVVGRGEFDVSLTLSAVAPESTVMATEARPALPDATPQSPEITAEAPPDSPVAALMPILPCCLGIMALLGIVTAAFLAIRRRRGGRNWTKS